MRHTKLTHILLWKWPLFVGNLPIVMQNKWQLQSLSNTNLSNFGFYTTMDSLINTLRTLLTTIESYSQQIFSQYNSRIINENCKLCIRFNTRADVINNLHSSITSTDSEIGNWMLQVMWLVSTNQSELFHGRVATLN